MPLYNLTNEKIEELKKQEKDKQTEHDDLVGKKPEQLWMHDLLELETAYDKWIESKEKDGSNTSTKKKKGLSIST
jgi:DNA topoisomerase-2